MSSEHSLTRPEEFLNTGITHRDVDKMYEMFLEKTVKSLEKENARLRIEHMMLNYVKSVLDDVLSD